MHVYVGQRCDLHQPQYLPTSATTSANTGTCVGHNTCICRPQYLFTSARAVVDTDHNICLRRPTLGPASATSPVYMSATIPVYVGQSCDLHRPQYVPTSATTSVYVGQHWDLRRPHNCPGHWPVAFPDSQGPRNPTGSAQCAGPGNGSSRHSVMALCGYLGYNFAKRRYVPWSGKAEWFDGADCLAG